MARQPAGGVSTRDLWARTHRALCEKDWSVARALLDDLGLRKDIHRRLLSARAYGVPDVLLGVLGDRIDFVNSKVPGAPAQGR